MASSPRSRAGPKSPSGSDFERFFRASLGIAYSAVFDAITDGRTDRARRLIGMLKNFAGRKPGWPAYAKRAITYLEIDYAERAKDDAAVVEVCERTWPLFRDAEDSLDLYTFSMCGALRRLGRFDDALSAARKSLRRALRIRISAPQIAKLTALCEAICEEGALPAPTSREYRRGVKLGGTPDRTVYDAIARTGPNPPRAAGRRASRSRGGKR